MIVSIIGTLFSFISIIQNISKKETLNEKIQSLKDACSKLDVIYTILSESKKMHNEFQKYETAIFSNMRTLKKGKGNLSQIESADAIGFIIQITNQMIRTRQLSISDFEQNDNGKSLPVEIINNCTEISRKYPMLVDNLNAFICNFEKIKELLAVENFGNEMEATLLKMENSIKEIQNYADDIILNTAPVLDFIHFKIKDALNLIA